MHEKYCDSSTTYVRLFRIFDSYFTRYKMLNQRLQQKLQQKLSPQQIQVIKLLEVPTMMLEQRIKQEIEENPALDLNSESEDFESVDESNESNSDEFDLDDYFNEDEYSNYKYQSNNYSKDSETKEIPFSAGVGFHEQLLNQLGLHDLTEYEITLAEYVIGNIDEDGYLRRELINISDDLAFSQSLSVSEEELERVLLKIQRLDPAGVGARDLQECLILQLKRRKNDDYSVSLAYKVIDECFDEFTRKHYSKIQQKLSITEEELKEAIDEILKLNPKPGSSMNDPIAKTATQAVIPDFILEEADGDLQLSMNNRNVPELRISSAFAEMIKGYQESKEKSKEQKEAVSFVKQKLDSAKWFIDAIRQRHDTLLSTMHTILDFQKDFFKTGDETKLRPMILKDIADITGLDVSTISRVANSKYIQTPFGVYSLKYFFSESMQTNTGEEVSSREIKSILQQTIDAEDKKKPLTDEKLAAVLKDKGYVIARRTVAKYREQLGIPVGRLRKEL